MTPLQLKNSVLPLSTHANRVKARLDDGAPVALIGLICCACLFAATQAFGAHKQDLGCSAPSYAIVAIPLVPAALNDSGVVVGRTDDHRAAMWSAKVGLRELPMPAGYDEAEAAAINTKGAIVGTVRNRLSQSSRAFYYSGGRLLLLPGEPAKASGINDLPEIVGQSLGPHGAMVPSTWQRFKLLQLQNCCGGVANAINYSGKVIGNIYDSSGQYHAAIWTDAGHVPFVIPTIGFSAALAIAPDGTTIVRTISDTFLYSTGLLQRLEVPRERRLKALAVNACHVVVGAFGPHQDADRAFLWHESDGFRDLNLAIEPGSKWVLETATSINTRGVIVGTGDFDGDENVGFMLIPGGR